MFFKINLLAAILFTFCSFAGDEKKDGACKDMMTDEGFKAVVESFLVAVKNRNFEKFKGFFRNDLEFKAVLPGNKVFNDVPAFLESQAAWFNGVTGTFNFKVETAKVAGEVGTAATSVLYENVDTSGTPFALKILITFKFAMRDGQWFLIYDHNQVLEKK